MTLPRYELLAIRYATNPGARSPDNFIDGDPHDVSMPLDYFVWLIRAGELAVLVDTGFDQIMAKRRGRNYVACPGATMARLGVNPASIADIIVTHMHYDHAGNHHLFPKARYHLQDREMCYATGRAMRHGVLRRPFEADDVVEMVRKLFKGRVVFHDGNAELIPGVELYRVGGHTDGLQIVRVHTARGWVVIASDASHFYANLRQRRSFPLVYNVGDMLEGFDLLEQLASGPDHIIPGHDPLVTERFPPEPGFDGLVLRLDKDPVMNV